MMGEQMADQLIESMTAAEMDALTRDLTRFMVSEGEVGAAPEWLGQYNASRALSCPPWELNDVWPHLPPASRAVWVARAACVADAERRGSEIVQRRQRARY